jgi:hypothetical protein
MLSLLDPTRPEQPCATDTVDAWLDADDDRRTLRTCRRNGVWFVTAMDHLVAIAIGSGLTLESAHATLVQDMRRHGVL